MWLKVVLLHALLHCSTAEVFTLCLNARPEFGCNVPERQIRCPNGIAGFQRFQYVLEKQPQSRCCAGMDVACREPNQNLLEILRNYCTKKPACSIPLDITDTYDETVDLSCGGYEKQRFIMSQIEVEYTCLSGVEAKGKTLRATGNSNVSGDPVGTPVVVVTIVSVLAVLAIVAGIIIALIVYKRRSRKKAEERNKNTTEERRGSKVNNGFEGEYNTIPADYDTSPNTSYQALGYAQSSNEHEYSLSARKPSGKYSTIDLNDDIETVKSAYSHYDKANLRKENAEKEKTSENIHAYSHFSETPDGYNRVTSKNSRLGIEEDYSKFGSEVQDDYSHLNDKQDITNSPNDYKVLETKAKQTNNAPEKNVAGYKQLVVMSASNPKNEETAITDYETPINLERSENYVVTDTNHVSNEKLKRAGSYEQPVSLELDFESSNKPYAPIKRVDSYEKPVLKSSHSSITDYETPVNLKSSEKDGMNNTYHVSNEELKGIDSSEKTEFMSTTEVENKQYNEQNDSHISIDNYETPMTLKIKHSVDSESENSVRL